MPMIRLIISITALLTMTAASAADVARDICAAHSQSDMRTCLASQAKESATELAAAEDAANSALSQWDEDAKYRASASAALKRSTKSFIQFRAMQCSFTASLGGGAIGNALALRELACVSDLNRQQTAWLRQAIADLPAR
jgi:uncharacterized protein YecT (DUF1311 family)